jgi:predicted dehydrogenase
VEKVCAWIDETPALPGIMQDVPAVIMWKYADQKVYGVWDITSAPDLYVKGKYYTCDERMEVTGTRGVLWLTRCTAEMLENVAPVVLYRDGKVTEFWDVPSDWQDAFIHSTIDFIESVRDHREPVLSGERGKEVLAFALAALASSEQQKERYLTQLTDRKKQKRRGVLSIFGKKKG